MLKCLNRVKLYTKLDIIAAFNRFRLWESDNNSFKHTEHV